MYGYSVPVGDDRRAGIAMSLVQTKVHPGVGVDFPHPYGPDTTGPLVGLTLRKMVEIIDFAKWELAPSDADEAWIVKLTQDYKWAMLNAPEFMRSLRGEVKEEIYQAQRDQGRGLLMHAWGTVGMVENNPARYAKQIPKKQMDVERIRAVLELRQDGIDVSQFSVELKDAITLGISL